VKNVEKKQVFHSTACTVIGNSVLTIDYHKITNVKVLPLNSLFLHLHQPNQAKNIGGKSRTERQEKKGVIL